MPTLDKGTLKVLREDIDAALAPIIKKHGLTSLRAANATFDPAGGSFKFNLEGIVGGGRTPDASRYENSRMPWWPELGAELMGNPGSEITGMTRGGKVTFRKSDGKEYTMRDRAALDRLYPPKGPEADAKFANAKVDPPPPSTGATLIKAVKAVRPTVERLAARWQDEHEYESWDEYISVARKACTENGAEFVKLTKSPFALTLKVGTTEWRITA